MNSSFLPSISEETLRAVKDDHWTYLNEILAAYQTAIIEDANVQNQMSLSQHALMAYAAFHSNVAVGGFIQLIQNGYGGYIFDNPFGQTFGAWGATMTASLIEQAKPIYETKKEELEKKTSLEEFAKMYEAIPDFDELDQTYTRVMEEEAELVMSYVRRNLGEFVRVVDH